MQVNIGVFLEALADTLLYATVADHLMTFVSDLPTLPMAPHSGNAGVSGRMWV